MLFWERFFSFLFFPFFSFFLFSRSFRGIQQSADAFEFRKGRGAVFSFSIRSHNYLFSLKLLHYYFFNVFSIRFSMASQHQHLCTFYTVKSAVLDPCICFLLIIMFDFVSNFSMIKKGDFFPPVIIMGKLKWKKFIIKKNALLCELVIICFDAFQNAKRVSACKEQINCFHQMWM